MLVFVYVCGCPTPAQAQETLANEARPHLANHGQVGLPGLRQYPTERSQKEEVQKGSGHSAQSLETKGGRRKKQGVRNYKKRMYCTESKKRCKWLSAICFQSQEGEREREKVIEKEKWKRATDINESRVETDSFPLWCEN